MLKLYYVIIYVISVLKTPCLLARGESQRHSEALVT